MSVISQARTKPAAAPIGTGELHQALEAASRTAALNTFCQVTGTAHQDVSSDGINLDPLRVFDAMRARGYEVSRPQRPQHQPRKGYTAWSVHVRMAGAELALGFYTADAP